MVTIKILLSTTARLKASSNDYDERFAGGNKALFTKIVEKDSYKIPHGFSYGSTHKVNTFSCIISADPYYIKQFESYDCIKVIKVSNSIEKIVFIGSKPSFKRTVEKKDWWTETVTFEDLSSNLNDLLFNSNEDWSWKINTSHGYKICDPNDTSHSLLHYLFNTYLNQDKKLTLHCTYSDTLVIPTFTITGKQKVLEVWQKFLEQQALAYYIENNDLYVIDILEDKTTTATTIPNVESKATINDKLLHR